MKNEIELNKGLENPSEDAQADKSLEDEMSLEAPKVVEEETVESLKARLAKAEEERENYKKGMFKYKNAPKGEVVEEGTENAEMDTMEETRTIARETAREVISRDYEVKAVTNFKNKYVALKEDPIAWRKVLDNLSSSIDKSSVSSIELELEAALAAAKVKGGGKVADKEITLNNFASVSYAGSIAPHRSTNEVSEGAIEMGRAFKNSAEDLKKAYEPGANEIIIA